MKQLLLMIFEFAWKRVLDPETAAEYAFILYPIKNAEAVNQGDLPKRNTWR